MSSRIDISPNVIHFTKGQDIEEAFKNLTSIIGNRVIYGNNNLIKGNYKCVCFSEAPLDCISNGLCYSQNYMKYSPFGIITSKKWLFNLGGRPVIYQPEVEYKILSEEQKWKHVTYNLSEDNPVDFTWEREWRIKIDKLDINPMHYSIIMPNIEWANKLLTIHDDYQHFFLELYNPKDIYSYYEPFPWHIYFMDYK